VGFVDLPTREAVEDALTRVTEEEAVRHDRISEVIDAARRERAG